MNKGFTKLPILQNNVWIRRDHIIKSKDNSFKRRSSRRFKQMVFIPEAAGGGGGEALLCKIGIMHLYKTREKMGKVGLKPVPTREANS